LASGGGLNCVDTRSPKTKCSKDKDKAKFPLDFAKFKECYIGELKKTNKEVIDATACFTGSKYVAPAADDKSI
jgi:hypothetical protein